MARAGKMSQLARRKATIGRVVRGRGGVIAVEYTTGIVDNGAPEYFVTNLCRVEKLGPGTVRITWGSRQEDGTILVVYKAIMDLKIWLGFQKTIEEARMLIERLPPDGDGMRKGQH